jgi:hypothetical protein
VADLHRVIAEFQRIKGLGYVISDKPYAKKNDGAVGNTFESLLGVSENNLRAPDFAEWECKSQRQHTSSAATLFSRKPDFPVKADHHMREEWGIPDPTGQYPHIKVFRTSVYAHRWAEVYGKYRMKLEVNESENKLKILLCDLDETLIDDSVYWFLDSLKKASSKLKNTFLVKAEEKVIDGKIHFKFLEGHACVGFNFERCIELIKEGKVRYDNRLGIYRTGKLKGKPHNHGGGLRLSNPSENYRILFDRFIEL